mmetsp:Transcript_13637/g.42148  ORF Transcript_13637/g.42148 Transcript_13637/m.42148 type:complete len:233 (-) Transcript_13637:489-1187(-)
MRRAREVAARVARGLVHLQTRVAAPAALHALASAVAGLLRAPQRLDVRRRERVLVQRRLDGRELAHDDGLVLVFELQHLVLGPPQDVGARDALERLGPLASQRLGGAVRALLAAARDGLLVRLVEVPARPEPRRRAERQERVELEHVVLQRRAREPEERVRLAAQRHDVLVALGLGVLVVVRLVDDDARPLRRAALQLPDELVRHDDDVRAALRRALGRERGRRAGPDDGHH